VIYRTIEAASTEKFPKNFSLVRQAILLINWISGVELRATRPLRDLRVVEC